MPSIAGAVPIETLRQLGELFRWEEEFGYRLDTGKGNLDALADGFDFPALTGGRTALILNGVDTLGEERARILGLLSIASDHSTYHLALGSRFITVLPLSNESPLPHATFSSQKVPHAWSLGLPKGEK